MPMDSHFPVNGSFDWGNHNYTSQPYNEDPAENTIDNIVLPIICVCGILGIIFTVVVLSRKSMCTSTNCYLMALAIADLIFLLLFASRMIEKHLEEDSQDHMHFRIYGAYASIFMNVFLLTSVWITVILALERYIAICRPFLAAKVCTVNRARVFVVLIFIFAFICRVANFWEHKLESGYDPVLNKSQTYLGHTHFSFDPHYMTVYPWVIDVTIGSIIPFVLLLVLNLTLIMEVRKSTRYVQRNMMVASRSSNSIQREEIQITIMLISVVIVFFVCQVPYVVYMAIMSVTKYKPLAINLGPFRHIAILLLALKSAINFLLYCWFSEKFWATFKRTFCVGRCAGFSKGANGQYNDLRRMSNCKTTESTI